MKVYIMGSQCFNNVVKLIPAEFSKGAKMILFYEKGRTLPGCVFEYISKGWITLKMLPAKMQDCIPIVTYELGIQHCLHPDDKFVLWGDAFLIGVFKFFLLYDDSVTSYLGIRDIRKDQADVQEKYPEEQKKEVRKKPEEKLPKKEKRPVKEKNPIPKAVVSDEDVFSDLLNKINEEEGAVLDSPAVPQTEKAADNALPNKSGVSTDKKREYDSPKQSSSANKADHPKVSVPNSKNQKETMQTAKSKPADNAVNHRFKEDQEKKPGVKPEKIDKQLPEKKSSENHIKQNQSAGTDLENVLGDFLKKECFKNFQVSDDEMRCVIMSLLVSVEASSVKSGLHLFKKQLEQFLSESRARVLYDKTAPAFNTFVDYFGNAAKDKESR